MADRPNIIMLYTHDTGRHLGCYGADVDTPNLDALAGEGVLFTEYHTTAPQCSPSRASMLSGQMPHTNGMMGLAMKDFTLNEGIPFLPHLFAEAGYDSMLFGFLDEYDWLEEKGGPQEMGFREFVKLPTRSCSDIIPALNQYLEDATDDPFFAMAGFAETHRPFDDKTEVPDDMTLPPFLLNAPETRKDIAGLNTQVRRIDEYVGRLLSTLEETGLDENTLVIFTTDHGIPFAMAKCSLYDAGTGITLMARGPEFEGGRCIDGMLSNMDFAPTLLDYAGIDVPAEMQGESFMPLVQGESDGRDSLFTELTYHVAYEPKRAVRTDRFKYIRLFEVRPELFPPHVDVGGSRVVPKRRGFFDRLRPFEMLFDVKADSTERNNLAERREYRETLNEMRRLLREWMEKTDDPLLDGPVPLPEGAHVTPPWASAPPEKWEDQPEL